MDWLQVNVWLAETIVQSACLADISSRNTKENKVENKVSRDILTTHASFDASLNRSSG